MRCGQCNRLFGGDDFAILVVAAIGAYAMRKFDLAALRAYGLCGRINTDVGAATRIGTGATGFALWYSHDKTPLNI